MIGAARTGLKIVAVFGDGAGFFAAVVAAALGNIDFAADYGLYVALTGFIEEIGGCEKVAVIGDGHGGHLLPRSLVQEFGSFARTVEKAVVGVNVQMNELRIAHGVSL
jgi:hypothetical protein